MRRCIQGLIENELVQQYQMSLRPDEETRTVMESVWVNGSVQFIDVETLVFKVHGVQEHCNNVLPLTIRAVESWVEINRHVTAVKSVKAPPMVKHR